MNRTNAIPRIALVLVGLALLPPDHVLAANMRTFIESVRRKAAVVYVGTVKEARILERTKFDLKARAVVSISAVARGPESRPAEATFEYSSYDEKTPMLAGGPQYQLQPGTRVVIFADSFSSANRPAYLIQGDRAELRQRVEALRDSLRKLSAEQLRVQEITEEDRQVQLTLYEKLIAAL
jgi:hypothetical protein